MEVVVVGRDIVSLVFLLKVSLVGRLKKHSLRLRHAAYALLFEIFTYDFGKGKWF